MGQDMDTERSSTLKIDSREIGASSPPYIVAELSGNHNGELERALQIIDAAKEAGADAIKLQTYTAETITFVGNGAGERLETGLWRGKTLAELYEEAHTPWEWHPHLFERAREIGLTIFSSPFDESAVDFLEELGTPAYKIASFEIVDLPLIRKAAATGKPLVISTGLADLREIEEALDAAREVSRSPVALLHCVSAYPAPPADANLRTIADLQDRFGIVVGLSDHTTGIAVAVAAVASGAAIIEKHLTLERAAGGVDSAFSLEPHEFAQMAAACRTAWEALGEPTYEPRPSEVENRRFRPSLYVVRDMEAGDLFTEDDVRSLRPADGLPPKQLPAILGKRSARRIAAGTPLSAEMIADD